MKYVRHLGTIALHKLHLTSSLWTTCHFVLRKKLTWIGIPTLLHLSLCSTYLLDKKENNFAAYSTWLNKLNNESQVFHISKLLSFNRMLKGTKITICLKRGCYPLKQLFLVKDALDVWQVSSFSSCSSWSRDILFDLKEKT